MDAAQERQDSGVDAEADGEADAGHHRHDEDVPGEVGRGPADEHRGPGHRKRTETLHQAGLHVGRQPDRRVHRPEHRGLHEDAGDQEVGVTDPVSAGATTPPNT